MSATDREPVPRRCPACGYPLPVKFVLRAAASILAERKNRGPARLTSEQARRMAAKSAEVRRAAAAERKK